jgi:hypothetical protein
MVGRIAPISGNKPAADICGPKSNLSAPAAAAGPRSARHRHG